MKMIKQQDKSLAVLDQGLDRLQNTANEIKRETKEQTIMLDQLGNEIDDASSRLKSVQDALGKLLKTKDGCQIWTIVALAVVLFILVALVIWA